ncbi:MAG: response regulator transcription factor [Nitrospira sp.]
MGKPRVLMADDHAIMLAGLCRLIEDQFDIVGMVENGRVLIETAEQLKPDVILLDIAMPLLNGIEAARQLKKSQPETKLIFLTMHASPVYATEAFKVGGSGYLLKQSAASELPLAIKVVLQGKYYLTPSLVKPMIKQALKAEEKPAIKGYMAELTPRQREVLQLISEGMTTKEIAEVLRLSVKTVESHRASLMNELEIHSTAGLVRYALTEGVAMGNSYAESSSIPSR